MLFFLNESESNNEPKINREGKFPYVQWEDSHFWSLKL